MEILESLNAALSDAAKELEDVTQSITIAQKTKDLLLKQIHERKERKRVSDNELVGFKNKLCELRQLRQVAKAQKECLEEQYAMTKDASIALLRHVMAAFDEFANYSSSRKQQVLQLESEASQAGYWIDETSRLNSLMKHKTNKLLAARAGKRAVVEAEDLILAESLENEENALIEAQATLSKLKESFQYSHFGDGSRWNPATCQSSTHPNNHPSIYESRAYTSKSRANLPLYNKLRPSESKPSVAKSISYINTGSDGVQVHTTLTKTVIEEFHNYGQPSQSLSVPIEHTGANEALEANTTNFEDFDPDFFEYDASGLDAANFHKAAQQLPDSSYPLNTSATSDYTDFACDQSTSLNYPMERSNKFPWYLEGKRRKAEINNATVYGSGTEVPSQHELNFQPYRFGQAMLHHLNAAKEFSAGKEVEAVFTEATVDGNVDRGVISPKGWPQVVFKTGLQLMDKTDTR